MARVTFKAILLKKYKDRKKKNSQYSLRAYARDLDIPPSRLSELLSGKCGVSKERAEQIANKLKLENDEKELFCDLITAKFSRSKKDTKPAIGRIMKKKYINIANDLEEVIRDWKYFAILELTHLNNFDSKLETISKYLNISVKEANACVDRLVKCNLLEVNSKGVMIDKFKYITSLEDVPSVAVKESHKRIYDLAKIAIDEQNVNERDFNTQIFSIDARDIDTYKQMIDDFIESVAKHSGARQSRDKVYCLNVGFFNLLHKNKEEETS